MKGPLFSSWPPPLKVVWLNNRRTQIWRPGRLSIAYCVHSFTTMRTTEESKKRFVITLYTTADMTTAHPTRLISCRAIVIGSTSWAKPRRLEAAAHCIASGSKNLAHNEQINGKKWSNNFRGGYKCQKTIGSHLTRLMWWSLQSKNCEILVFWSYFDEKKRASSSRLEPAKRTFRVVAVGLLDDGSATKSEPQLGLVASAHKCSRQFLRLWNADGKFVRSVLLPNFFVVPR